MGNDPVTSQPRACSCALEGSNNPSPATSSLGAQPKVPPPLPPTREPGEPAQRRCPSQKRYTPGVQAGRTRASCGYAPRIRAPRPGVIGPRTSRVPETGRGSCLHRVSGMAGAKSTTLRGVSTPPFPRDENASQLNVDSASRTAFPPPAHADASRQECRRPCGWKACPDQGNKTLSEAPLPFFAI